jgi:hypothetical protein
LIDTVYYLKDALRDNPDIQVRGMFYEYRPQRYNFDPVNLGDTSDLKLLPPVTDTSLTIPLGILSFPALPPESTYIAATSLFPFLPPDRDTTIDTPIPGVALDTMIEIRLTDIFDYLELISGTLHLRINNNLPTTISFSPGAPIEILSRDFSVIATLPYSTIPSNSSQTQSGSLASARLTNPIFLHVRLQVDNVQAGETFTPTSGIGFLFFIEGPLDFKEGSIKKPPTFSALANVATLLVDDSTFVINGTFKRGGIQLNFSNNFNVGVGFSISIPEFALNSNTTVRFNRSVLITPLNPDTTITVPLDTLPTSYQILSDHPAGSDSLHYNFGFTTLDLDTSRYTIFYDTNSVSLRVQFTPTPFYLKSISGRYTPTFIPFTRVREIDSLRLGSDFTSDSILLGNDTLKFYVYTAAGHPVDLQGTLRGLDANGNPTGTPISIPSTNPPGDRFRFLPGGDNVILFDVGILNSLLRNQRFPDQQPRQVEFNGSVIVNPIDVYDGTQGTGYPGYTGTLNDTMKLYTSLEFSVPMEVAIYNGAFHDTVFIGDTTSEGTKIDEDILRSLRGGTISFSISNTIPAHLGLRVNFLDNANQDVLAEMPLDSLDLLPALNQTPQIRLRPEQSLRFSEVAKTSIKLLLDTQNQTAVFDTTQYVQVRAYANLRYRVNSVK